MKCNGQHLNIDSHEGIGCRRIQWLNILFEWVYILGCTVVMSAYLSSVFLLESLQLTLAYSTLPSKLIVLADPQLRSCLASTVVSLCSSRSGTWSSEVISAAPRAEVRTVRGCSAMLV